MCSQGSGDIGKGSEDIASGSERVDNDQRANQEGIVKLFEGTIK